MNIIPSLQVTGSALDAERTRLDIIAQNIANANTTRDTTTGKAYQRKVVSFETEMTQASKDLQASGNYSHSGIKGVRVSSITSDATPGERVYNPGSPDADKDGMVAMPNVQVAREMVDMITSSRAYEANLTMAKNGKAMADSALRLGRDI